jgi:hypothetical protein
MVDEPSPVVGITVEPVAGEPMSEPHPPPDDEPLHQVHVEQAADDMSRRQAGVDQHGHPKAVNSRVFRRPVTLERGLECRELVVGLIAEQHVEADTDHHRQQQHAHKRPHWNALAPLEIVAGDAPELLPHLVNRAISASAASMQTAPMTHALATHSSDVTSSLPQSRVGVNVSIPGSYRGGVTRERARRLRPGRAAIRPRRAARARACDAARRWSGG